ncbi:protein FAR1-RELATED SEQUENCE 5 isoform X2 [Vigna angularis]|uniref:protein FAR1-RELATED SEQUENCE 5 isoform X2 n=1 Tax=Phaseolus angularis TaxID=3914 RepID=UPI0022B3A932|nr:protein FAR1-RELATED SEQUENCE 5 isoform X2 [Vigna angularis]
MEGTEPDIERHPLEDAENECPISAEVVLGQESQTRNPCDSSVEDTIKVIDTENECTRPNVCAVDHSHIKINDECQTSNIFHDDKFHIDNVSSGELCENPCPSTEVKNENEIYVAPKIGMEFESEDNAYKCYSMYAVLKGFSIRKDFVNKSRINGAVVSRRYTCHRQGYRPNKNGTYLRKFQQETRTGCLAHMTIARQPNGKFQVTHFETEHNHEFVKPCTAHMLPSQKKLSFAQAIEANLTVSGLDETPKLGMGFDSDKHAYEFYNTYAGRVGFSVRKDYVNRSKIDGAVASRRFTCFREGFRQKDKQDMNTKKPRKDTRIGCLAQMVISRQPDGMYYVTHFEEKHNHELVAACRVHMLRSQQKGLTATQIEKNIVDGSNVLPTSTSETNCKARLDYDPVNHEYKLPFKCSSKVEGEIEKIKLHFQIKQRKNHSFFYAFQFDADDQITNIFWADTKMIIAYTDFGDVVCFDSSYKYYKDSWPFVPFLGINNHQQMTIFGVALLQNESVESLKWLFIVFLEAMSGRKPKTILTDLDVVTAEAINVILPQTNHRVCVWHVYQDALKHLSHVSAGSDSFVNDLRSCLFHHEEEDYFVNEWNTLLDKYNLWENEWLQQIFGSRHRWAIAYGRQYFCADIESMLLRQNLTGNLKRYPC